MNNDSYAIGDKIWSRGDQYTVVSAPYALHGGQWQDAKSGDRTITVPTPGQKARDEAMRAAARQELQAGFRRLHSKT